MHAQGKGYVKLSKSEQSKRYVKFRVEMYSRAVASESCARFFVERWGD
jgi:hypothetical protein